MPIVFAREVMDGKIMDEMVPLIASHYFEVSRFKDIQCRPDWGAYGAMERAGTLRLYTARANGVLVGYSVFMVAPHPHFSGSLQATEDLLFIDDDFRQGMTGYNFIKWCDDQLTADGVEVIYHSVNSRNDFSPLLTRLGYEVVDLVYARRVNSGS